MRHGIQCFTIDQAAIYRLPRWRQRVARIVVNRLVRARILVGVDPDGDETCERCQSTDVRDVYRSTTGTDGPFVLVPICHDCGHARTGRDTDL